MRATLEMLTWSGSMGDFVYHTGLPPLIVKIAQFPRKEGFRKSELIKRTRKRFDLLESRKCISGENREATTPSALPQTLETKGPFFGFHHTSFSP